MPQNQNKNRSAGKQAQPNRKKNNNNNNKNKNKNNKEKNEYMTHYAPSASSKPYVAQFPKQNTQRTKSRLSTRIQRREFIGRVHRAAATPYELLYSLPLNPGMATTFPWLSTQAANWEQYSFSSLKFEYVARCGTSTSGSITMGPDYDANDPAPSSSPVLCDYQDAKDGSCWAPLTVTLDRDAMMTPSRRKYIRNGPRPLEDIKTYDSGNFYLAADGTTSTNEWGVLWVEYDVTLYVPQLEGGANALVTSPSQATRYNANNPVVLVSGVATIISWTTEDFNLLGVIATVPTTDLVPLNGAYVVIVQFQISSDAITAITLSGALGGTTTAWWTPIRDTQAVPGVAALYTYGSTAVVLGDGVKTVRYSVTVTGTGVLSLNQASILFLPC